MGNGLQADSRHLLEMARVMRRRGPDDEGFVLINSVDDAFLEPSGGMDSSSLVALAAADSSQTVRTYTVKNCEAQYDEEPYAKAVQEFYEKQIDYRILVPEKIDFWQQADAFVWVQEEPFHSPNLQTNQRIRQRMRSDGARVVVSGAGGDEVLADYVADYLWPYLHHLLGQGDLRGLSRAGQKLGTLVLEVCRYVRGLVIAARYGGLAAAENGLSLRPAGMADPLARRGRRKLDRTGLPVSQGRPTVRVLPRSNEACAAVALATHLVVALVAQSHRRPIYMRVIWGIELITALDIESIPDGLPGLGTRLRAMPWRGVNSSPRSRSR